MLALLGHFGSPPDPASTVTRRVGAPFPRPGQRASWQPDRSTPVCCSLVTHIADPVPADGVPLLVVRDGPSNAEVTNVSLPRAIARSLKALPKSLPTS